MRKMLLPSGRSNTEIYPFNKTSSRTFPINAPTSLIYSKCNDPECNKITSGDDSNLETKEKKMQSIGCSVLTNPEGNFQKETEVQPIEIINTSYHIEKNIPTNVAMQNNTRMQHEEIQIYLNKMQSKLQDGWTVHARKDGRLYYCNHFTKSSSWLPSIDDWWKTEDLPYGWERAIDLKGRLYYINHQNKTTTYEAPERISNDEHPPQSRLIILERSPNCGFGFVAGSERPVLIRFITEGGPSINKLLPGDQILAVNGEDVKDAARDHVIQLIRACEKEVSLLVCQPILSPPYGGRKSTLLSAGKRAKLRNRPNRVRFAESVCVNGSPLFPPSAFSLSDLCVPPMANVLKVFLENGQTKSFKYDASTTVNDVTTSLRDKLCLKTSEIFSLVLEHVKSLKRNKFSLLDPEESLAKIAARPGSHKLRCLFRVTFVPTLASQLAEEDVNALDYLYMQCCNDVTQERFAPELQPEMALRLAALQMYQHATANSVSTPKLNVKMIEREFGLERFLPASLMEGMKRKELRRLLQHFYAEMTCTSNKSFSALQAKIKYLDIIATLPSYGAKCFSTNQRIGVERIILVGPRFGLSQISNARNSMPQGISAIEDLSHIIINKEDDVNFIISIYMKQDKIVKFSMEDRDAIELSLVLAGYFRVLTGEVLTVLREQNAEENVLDNAPAFLAQHTVLPAYWSYLENYHDRAQSVNFSIPPIFHSMENNEIIKQLTQKIHLNTFESNNVKSTNNNDPETGSVLMDVDIHSMMATALLEDAKDSRISDSSGVDNSCFNIPQNTLKENVDKDVEILRRVQEMQKMVQNSEQYLSEHGEIVKICANSSAGELFKTDGEENTSYNYNQMNCSTWYDLESDCESSHSNKVLIQEDIPKQATLNHSDSLVLLSEIITKDLNGICNGLNSINENKMSCIQSSNMICKDQTLSQLLENMQINAESSQYESDAESLLSPINSPTLPRSNFITNINKLNQKQKSIFRGSFLLHSPDNESFDCDLQHAAFKSYLTPSHHDINQRRILDSKAYHPLPDSCTTEVLENDSDLIDLRAIPPPRTPDDLDAFLLVSDPPQGFDDCKGLDEFLEKVLVAPPIHKMTPSKELTPEEIMSFIIPPPPNANSFNLESNDTDEKNHLERNKNEESFYTNSASYSNSEGSNYKQDAVIEYVTVEKKPSFFCCPQKEKNESNNELDSKNNKQIQDLPVPPRDKFKNKMPPVRPPKSVDLIKKLSPKKTFIETKKNVFNGDLPKRKYDEIAPLLPPRPNHFKQSNTSRLDANKTKFNNSPSHVFSPDNRELQEKHFNFVSSSNDSTNHSFEEFSRNINESPTASKAQHDDLEPRVFGKKIIIKNGHVIDIEALLAKTEVALSSSLLRIDQLAADCTTAHAAGGGTNINDDKFEQARNELTEQTLSLVTASKFLVVAMSDSTLQAVPEHLTSCLTALRRITELSNDMTRYTSAPLQTRNIVLKVHDVASGFRELVQVDIGPLGAGQLALRAECLANFLATLLRSLRVFSP